MINILLASHSRKVVEGLREILVQMAPDVNIQKVVEIMREI